MKGSTVKPGILVTHPTLAAHSSRQSALKRALFLPNSWVMSPPTCLSWELSHTKAKCRRLQVLLNDVDWELTGRDETEVKEGDRVTFISTLHGG